MTAAGETTSSPPILVIGGEGTPLAEVAANDPAVELVPGAAAVVARMTDGDEQLQLVVLAPGTERPFTTARELRSADPRVGVVLTVPAEEVEGTRDRLAFAPDLSGVAVLGVDSDPTLLTHELHAAAERVTQRRQLRVALDRMNRGLAARTAPPDDLAPARSVSDRYLAALTRNLPEGVVSIDRHGRIVTLNPSASEVLGVPIDEAEGRPFTGLLTSEAPDVVQDILDRAGGGEVAEHDDLVVRRPDGARGVVSLTAAPVTDDGGGLVGIVLLIRDVTDERRTEERLRELQKAESLATLAGGVAHDFNNLLVSVQSWAGIASDDIGDQELVSTALVHIERASRRAAELARSMLAYAGRGTFELGPTDVNEVVREMTGLLKAAISRKTEMVLELSSPLPIVHGDATQLRQVVMNLVTNAAEAIEGKPGTIHLRTGIRRVAARDADADEAPALPSGTYVVIEVEDTGAGMDEVTMGRIFDPFFTTKFTGRGLGLAASHGIVRAHGGDIEAESERGRGTVFRVLLPVEEEVAA